MKAYYPKDYWKNKYEQKSSFGKYKHALGFMYKSAGLKGVVLYHWAMLKLLIMIFKK